MSEYVKDVRVDVDPSLQAQWRNNVHKSIEKLDCLEICKQYPYPTNLPKISKFSPVVYSKELFPIFNCINIETTSWCNCKCFFCPSPLLNRDAFFMDNSLFEKIIIELGLMDYNGEIRLYQSNEPLLDKNIVEKIRFVKKNVPRASIGMNSNGVLLDYNLLEQMYLAGLNFLAIESYHSEKEFDRYLQMFTKLKESYANIFLYAQSENGKYSYAEEKTKYKTKNFYITLSRRYKIEKYNKSSITSRAGVVECSTKKCKNTNICARPFRTMQVNWNGKVVVCCEEWLYGDGSIVGDLNKNTISEVWNGKPMMIIRSKLQDGIRDQYPCTKCNYGGGIYRQNIRRVVI